jgi:Flp pilus assembly protein TadD
MERQCLLQSGTAVHFFVSSSPSYLGSLCVFHASPSPIGNTSVIAASRLGLSRLLLTVICLAMLAGNCSPARAQQPKTRPAPIEQEKKAPPTRPAPANEELPRRLEAQRAAIQSGDANAVEQTSRRVAATAIRQLAVLRSTTGDFAKAIDLYRQSLNLEDVNDVRLELAIVLLSGGNRDSALEEAEKVVITQPDNARAWSTKGNAYAAKNDYKQSVEAFTRSLAIQRDVRPRHLA